MTTILPFANKFAREEHPMENYKEFNGQYSCNGSASGCKGDLFGGCRYCDEKTAAHSAGLTPQQVADDIDAFARLHIEPWRRAAANDALLLLYAKWTESARNKAAQGVMRACELVLPVAEREAVK